MLGGCVTGGRDVLHRPGPNVCGMTGAKGDTKVVPDGTVGLGGAGINSVGCNEGISGAAAAGVGSVGAVATTGFFAFTASLGMTGVVGSGLDNGVAGCSPTGIFCRFTCSSNGTPLCLLVTEVAGDDEDSTLVTNSP